MDTHTHTHTPHQGNQSGKIKIVSPPYQYPVLFEVTSHEQKTWRSLGKAVAVPLSPGRPSPSLGALQRTDGREVFADPPASCAQSWPCAFPWDLLFSRAAMSRQPCRNSIIFETYL